MKFLVALLVITILVLVVCILALTFLRHEYFLSTSQYDKSVLKDYIFFIFKVMFIDILVLICVAVLGVTLLV